MGRKLKQQDQAYTEPKALLIDGRRNGGHAQRDLCVKTPPKLCNFTFDYRREKNLIKPQNGRVHKGSKHSMLGFLMFHFNMNSRGA